MYPFYIAGEFFILSQLFLTALNATKKWNIAAFLMAIGIFTEGMILWFINNDASNAFGKLFSHLTIVSVMAYLLITKLKQLETDNPFLIIYAALFFYYGTSIFLFLLMNQLTETTIPIWTINNILASILYGSSIYTFYKLKRS